MSICWYLPVKPVLHIPEVIDIGVNTTVSPLFTVVVLGPVTC